MQHFGDSATWDFQKAKGRNALLHRRLTHVRVRPHDTEKCLALCNDVQATILWHDCDKGHPGVLRYLAELVKAQFPIKRVGWTHLAILDI